MRKFHLANYASCRLMKHGMYLTHTIVDLIVFLAKKGNLLKSVLAGAASSRRDQYCIIHYSFIISQYQNVKDVY